MQEKTHELADEANAEKERIRRDEDRLKKRWGEIEENQNKILKDQEDLQRI